MIMEDTNSEPDPAAMESKVLGVSMRDWLATMLVATVCGMSIWKMQVEEPLYTMTSIVVAFYFGHQVGKSAGK